MATWTRQLQSLKAHRSHWDDFVARLPAATALAIYFRLCQACAGEFQSTPQPTTRRRTLSPASSPSSSQKSGASKPSSRGSARGDSATIRTRRRHLRLDIKAVPHALHVGIPGGIAVIGVSLDLPCALQDLGVGRRDAEAVAHEAFRPFP